MDWARAKNILIALLAALNLILAAAIATRSAGDGIDGSFYVSVERILSDRGVRVLCAFPKQDMDSVLLVYGDGARFVGNCANALSGGANTLAGDGARVEMSGREGLVYENAAPEERLNTSSIAELDADIRQALKDRGVDIARFTTDYAEETGDGGFALRYILDFRGNMVFDSRVDVTVNGEGGITRIAINYREIKAVSQDRRSEVIPAYQVLLKNYYGEGPAISSIDIGFKGRDRARDNPFAESEEGAVWRVRQEDGTERFFESAYGDEI